MMKQGVKIWDMTISDKVRALSAYYGTCGADQIKDILGCSRYYAKKYCDQSTFDVAKLEAKWRKRMAQDLTRGMYIFNGRFLAFTKSKEYVDVENGRGMVERVDASDVLCCWREFYEVGK